MTNAIDTSARLRDELAANAPAPMTAPDSLPEPDPRQCVLLVDLGALYAHAWHATNRDSAPDEAAEAALRRVRAWGARFPHIAICCDDPSGNWRRAIFPAYKGTRSAKPDGYAAQLRRAIEILRRDGYPVWFCGDFEADDVMACGARCVVEGTALTAIIATADKDMMQLVTDRVWVFNTRTGHYMGPEQVRKHYAVRPDQIRDYLTLTGDSSDNIPGVPGIGKKTAEELLEKFDNLAAIVTAAENGRLKPQQNKQIVACTETIALARKLVGLRDDVPMPLYEVLRRRDSGRLSDPLPEPDDAPAWVTDDEPKSVPSPAAGGAEAPPDPEPAPAPKPAAPPPQTIEPTRIPETTMANVAPIQSAPSHPANQNGAAPKAQSGIVRGVKRGAHAFILTGRSGIGKTYLASTIPNVFFEPIENGLKGASPNHVDTLAHFGGRASTFDGLMDRMQRFRDCAKGEGFRHWVGDSLTAIERLIHLQVCSLESVAHMSAKEYKVVWTAAIPLWVRCQAELDKMRDLGVHVWLIAHSMDATEAVADTGETYQKADLAFQGSGKSLLEVRNLWRTWADHVLFLDWDTKVKAGTLSKKSVASYSSRIIRARETPFCYAKTRGSLPEKLPATWPHIEQALRAGVAIPEPRMRTIIASILPRLEAKEREEIDAALKNAKSPSAVASVLSRAQSAESAARNDDEDDVAPAATVAADVASAPAVPAPPTAEANTENVDESPDGVEGDL